MNNASVKIIAVAGLIIGLTFGACQEEKITPEKVQVTLDSLEMKLDWLNYRLAEQQWEAYTGGRADSLEFYKSLYKHVLSNPATFNILNQGLNLLKEEEDLRRLELLRSFFLTHVVENQKEISSLRDSLEFLKKTFEPEFMGSKIPIKDILDTLYYNKNRIHREMAYRARYAVGHKMDKGMERLFRIRNQEAHRNGYNNYLSMLFNREEYNQDEIYRFLNELKTLTENTYEAIIQNVCSGLALREVEIWDIPFYYAALFKEIDDYYPADSQLKYMNAGLSEIGFSLNKLPLYFDLEYVPEMMPELHSLLIKSPFDQRITGKLGDGVQNANALVKQVGEALYASHIAQEKPIFNYLNDDTWTLSMKTIFAFITEDRNWLERYIPMPRDLRERYLKAQREWKFINLRMLLVNLAFELEAYTNPRRDLNKVYWDIYEKYTLLPRHDDIKVWAVNMIYVERPLAQKNSLLADIVAAQTIAYLKKNYGSMVGNPETKAFLVQNYFRFGSRYKWRELVQRGTGEELNPRYYMSYLDYLTGDTAGTN